VPQSRDIAQISQELERFMVNYQSSVTTFESFALSRVRRIHIIQIRYDIMTEIDQAQLRQSLEHRDDSFARLLSLIPAKYYIVDTPEEVRPIIL
jgi:hypothetical protein